MSRLDAHTAAGPQATAGNRCTSAHVLAINAGGAATVKTTGAIVHTLDGVTRSKAALSAQSIAVTHNYLGVASAGYVQPASTTVYYTLAVNAAGSVAVVQGAYFGQTFDTAPTASLGQNSFGGARVTGDGAVPSVPAGYCPFGLVKVATNGSTTFTPGTTALDAAGVTASFFDLAVIPASKP